MAAVTHAGDAASSGGEAGPVQHVSRDEAVVIEEAPRRVRDENTG